MNKRDFLKTSGMIGVASLLPFKKMLADVATVQAGGCVLIPAETAGPFPLDLTANPFYFRQDITESKPGVPLNLRMKIIGDINCFPMQNLRVNIWHCDKDGFYSGYSLPTNPGQAGLTYLRGYQITDANGEVEFITIFPGWYPGRICHIHFQVYVSTSYAAISQLTFDVAAKQAIYAANGTVYTAGADPTTLTADNVFANGYTYQISPLTPNATTGGYDAFLEVTILGTGIATHVGNLEKETAKQFTLDQNYPNPYVNSTTIPVHLAHASDVKLDLYDLQGRIVKTILKSGLPAGDHAFELDMKSLGLASNNYAYQVEVQNANGIFRDCKLMTAVK